MKNVIFILYILFYFESLDSLPLFSSLSPLSAALRPLFPIGSNMFPGDSTTTENEMSTTQDITTETQISGAHLPNLQFRPPGLPLPLPLPLLPFPFPLPLLLDLPNMRYPDPSLPPLLKSAIDDGDDDTEMTTTMEEIFTTNLDENV